MELKIKDFYLKNLKKKTKSLSTSINKSSIKSDEKDIVNQLKKLNELYKSGALSKDEFEKSQKENFKIMLKKIIIASFFLGLLSFKLQAKTGQGEIKLHPTTLKQFFGIFGWRRKS